MINKLKLELEKHLYFILKNKNNSLTVNDNELDNFINLYKELNKNNKKYIIIPDLIPCISIISITLIMVTVLIKFL